MIVTTPAASDSVTFVPAFRTRLSLVSSVLSVLPFPSVSTPTVRTDPPPPLMVDHDVFPEPSVMSA